MESKTVGDWKDYILVRAASVRTCHLCNYPNWMLGLPQFKSSASPFNVIFIALKMLRGKCLGIGATLRGDLMQIHQSLDNSGLD